MQKSENIGELAEALSKFQAKVVDPIKNKKAHGYEYVDLPEILQMVRPLLTENGLSFCQAPGMNGDKTTIETMLIHKSGQYISFLTEINTLPTNARLNGTQAVGGTITYGRRYALQSILGIIADEDTDANHRGVNSNNRASSIQIETLLKLLNNDKDRIRNMMDRLKLENINNLTLDQYLTVTKSINQNKAEGE